METLRFELRPRGVGVPLCYLYTKFPLMLYTIVSIGDFNKWFNISMVQCRKQQEYLVLERLDR